MDMIQSRRVETNATKRNMLSNKNLNKEIEMMKASTQSVIGDISFQQKQLRKKYNPETMKKRIGYTTSPVLQRKDILKQQHRLASTSDHERPKSSNAMLTKNPQSESVHAVKRCSSSKDRMRITTRAQQEVPHIPLRQSPPSSVCSNETKVSKTTSQISSFPTVKVPSIVVDDLTECSTTDLAHCDENSLNIPNIRPRCNSMPNVCDRRQFRSSNTAKSHLTHFSESRKKVRSSSITSLNQSVPRQMGRAKSDSLLPQRRRSINISVNLLIRDLWHGIQHAELGKETTSSWSVDKKMEWEKLRSCRYLRFPKYANSDDSSDDSTDVSF